MLGPVDGRAGTEHDRPVDLDRDDPLDDGDAGLDDDVLDAREAARIRRRDHDTEAEQRELMRPGMGKVFKQIDDAIGRRATEPPTRRRRQHR